MQPCPKGDGESCGSAIRQRNRRGTPWLIPHGTTGRRSSPIHVSRNCIARRPLFLWGLMVFSVVFYFLLPIGAAYFQELFRVKVWGPVNVGILFALSEFVVAWAHRVHLRAPRQHRVRRRWPPRSSATSRSATGAGNERPARCASAPRPPRCSPWRRPRSRRAPSPTSGAGSRSSCSARSSRMTMFVTYLAAKRVKSAADFYTAGGGVSGLQNGWAIAGDYLSAASFLGIAGPDLDLGLRRLHVLGRLAGRVHHRAAGHRRAVPQHRQVHAGRHPRVPQQSARHAHRRRHLGHHRVDVLPDRADGRRRRAGEDADRHRLRDLGRSSSAS